MFFKNINIFGIGLFLFNHVGVILNFCSNYFLSKLLSVLEQNALKYVKMH